MGFSVQLTQASRDGGVDLNVVDHTPIRGGRYIVQAKRYQGGVGEPIIRDLYGTLLHSGAVKAILITTGYFTEDAVSFAQGKPIELVDGKALTCLIDQYQLHHEFSVDASSQIRADEIPKLTKEAQRSILEQALKDDPNNLGIGEALLEFLPYEDQITLGEKLAYEIEEQTKGAKLPTKIAKILQSAYIEQAWDNPEKRKKATARGIQWTEFLLKAGDRSVTTIHLGGGLYRMSEGNLGLLAAFYKEHLDVVMTNAHLITYYCNCLPNEDAISILERVLSEKRPDFSKKELHVIQWALASHYEKSGSHDKAIASYRLATNLEDKEALALFLFVIREMKGKPAAYQEALRLLAEKGETLAALWGIAHECYFNDLETDQLRYLKRANAIAPNDREVCIELAIAYNTSGQNEEAAYWHKKAELLSDV